MVTASRSESSMRMTLRMRRALFLHCENVKCHCYGEHEPTKVHRGNVACGAV